MWISARKSASPMVAARFSVGFGKDVKKKRNCLSVFFENAPVCTPSWTSHVTGLMGWTRDPDFFLSLSSLLEWCGPCVHLRGGGQGNLGN